MRLFSILMLLAIAVFCWGGLVAPSDCNHDLADAGCQDCPCACCHADPAANWSGPGSPAHIAAGATFTGDDLIPPEEVPSAIEHPPQIA